MKTIPLTKNKHAIVDDNDFDNLSQWKWYANVSGKKDKKFYARRIVYLKDELGNKISKTIHMHRFIMNPPDEMYIDHINGDTLDNRKCNLRVCSHIENCRNKKNIWGKSKYRGVSWHDKSKRWAAYIRVDYKLKFIGNFITEIEAAIAYNIAAKEHHKEFARLNEI